MTINSTKKLIVSLGILILAIVGVLVLAVYQTGVQTRSSDLLLSQFSDTSTTQSSGVTITPIKPETPGSSAPAVSAVSGCGITLDFTATQKTIVKGGKIDYTMVLKNMGNTTCESPSVSVYYADNEVFASSSPRASASNYYWKLASLAAQTQATIIFSTTHSSTDTSGAVTTQACATANNGSDSCVTIKTLVSGTTTLNESDTEPEPVPAVTEPVSTPVVEQTPTVTSASSTKEYGLWVWVSPIQMTDTYMNKVLTTATNNNMNAVYITVDDYLDVHALPEGTNKENKKKAYYDALDKFVRAANAKGIAVDAEAGWRDWGEPAHRYKAYAIVEFVKAYNASGRTKVRALQYDVEPYLLPNYTNNKNKTTLLKNFVTMVDETVKRLGTSDVKLSVVIPHFYDSAQKWTPSFAYGGYTTYTYNHLLRMLDTRPGSTIILMSYRNFALGNDGTVDISDVEIIDASTGTHSTKVIVGQETGDVDPPYVTFFGKTKAYFLQQVDLVNTAFNQYSGFGGIAVHYIDPFVNLK